MGRLAKAWASRKPLLPEVNQKEWDAIPGEVVPSEIAEKEIAEKSARHAAKKAARLAAHAPAAPQRHRIDQRELSPQGVRALCLQRGINPPTMRAGVSSNESVLTEIDKAALQQDREDQQAAAERANAQRMSRVSAGKIDARTASAADYNARIASLSTFDNPLERAAHHETGQLVPVTRQYMGKMPPGQIIGERPTVDLSAKFNARTASKQDVNARLAARMAHLDEEERSAASAARGMLANPGDTFAAKAAMSIDNPGMRKEAVNALSTEAYREYCRLGGSLPQD